MSLKVLEDISKSGNSHEFGIQISNYHSHDNKYLILTSATKDPFRENQYRIISIGLLINKQLELKVEFLNDKNIIRKDVGITCECCAILDCKVRKATAIVLEKREKNRKIESISEELTTKFQA